MKRTIISMVLALLCVTGISAAKKVKNKEMVVFNHYGTEVQIHLDASKRVKVKKATDDEITKCMTWIESATAQTLKDCLQQKQEQHLCDWAYVKMIDRLSQTALGSTNEAVLLMTNILGRSGYDVRVSRFDNGQLRMFYQTDAFVYSKLFYTIEGKNYVLYGDSVAGSAGRLLDIISYQDRPIDFRQNQTFDAVQLTAPRTLVSRKNPDFAFTVQVNKNLIDYYNDMPAFMYDNNFMTRWTLMANRPLEQHLQQTLVKEMKAKLQGKSQLEQVQQLLWWMQGKVDLEGTVKNADTFLFGYDEDVWGYDRPFYSEETLFYPYCDTEDRSILLSRLVRDVVGLDCVFIYYPGHTAVGVCITDADVKGAYVVKNGRHYVVCDPTYIGSNVGEEMDGMENNEKTVMTLEK